MSVEQLKEEALKLSAEDRERLLFELNQAMAEREITPAEGANWNRRQRDLESGKSSGVTEADTFARLEKLVSNAANHIASGS